MEMNEYLSLGKTLQRWTAAGKYSWALTSAELASDYCGGESQNDCCFLPKRNDRCALILAWFEFFQLHQSCSALSNPNWSAGCVLDNRVGYFTAPLSSNFMRNTVLDVRFSVCLFANSDSWFFFVLFPVDVWSFLTEGFDKGWGWLCKGGLGRASIFVRNTVSNVGIRT